MRKISIILLLLISIVSENKAQELKLWYNQPARVWEEALPLGNSRLGVMFYGIPQRDELQLNEETIWGGSPYRNDNPKALGALPKVRELVFGGQPNEADKLLNSTFFTKTHGMPFQTAGSVILNFPGHEKYTAYYRELDLEKAVSTVKYTAGGIDFQREVFSSFEDNVIIMRITSSKKRALNFDLEYANPAEHTISDRNKILILNGRGADHEGIEGKVRYQIQTFVKNEDGNVMVNNKKLVVTDASTVVIYVSIATNFKDYKTLSKDYEKKASQYLSNAIKKNYNESIRRHSEIYKKQFDRCKIKLGSDTGSLNLPITERISGFQKAQDPSLVALLFQFGRYLLISSSQPGGQPANLQGIWCNSLYPAWDSKYTININTEMNYWPAEVTNLSETHQPLFQMIKELSQTGAETAKNMYGSEGWVAHHNTDIWRVTSPIDFAAAGMWPTGGAWLCQHLWEHYLFTGDKKFLAEYYPVMKGVADFFLSSLVKHPKYNWMVAVPSISPEQGPISAGCTMDNQLIFDIFTKTAEANQILNEDTKYRESLLSMSARLAPMHIGQYSQLQEWLEDVDDPKNEHRHVSHLYGLYPGNQITPSNTSELFEAARNSLLYRGDMATGWSIGWKINLWARLLDGNHAYKIVKNMLTLADGSNKDGRTYPNMFTAHPPFQIDGNFGLTAGVAEMLVQSHDEAVHLLPALPDVWKDGELSGIKARGGFDVSMKWKDGKVNEVTVVSTLGGNLRIRSSSPLKGDNLKEAKGENPNIYMKRALVAQPIISENASIKGLSLDKVYVYDIATTRGKKYTLTGLNEK